MRQFLSLLFVLDPKVPAPANNEVKFYTLNRKSTKKTNSVDPYARLMHNIEVDSLLRKDPLKSRATNGHDIENRRSYSFEVRPHLQPGSGTNDSQPYQSMTDIQATTKMNGSVAKGSPEKKQLARVVLSHHIKEAEKKEKRLSKDLTTSPVSTKGEVTTTVSTKSSPGEASSKRWSTNSPLQQRKVLPDHVTQFNKAGSAPPCLPPDKGEGVMMTSSISKAQGMKQLNTVGKQKSTSSVAVRKEHLNKGSSEQVPLIRREDSTESSGDLYSPSEDFIFVPGGGADRSQLPKRPMSGTSCSSSGSNQNYDRLDEFLGKKQDSWETFSNSESPSPAPPSITQQIPDDTYDDILTLSERRHSQNSSKMSDSSNESGIYDHLPVLSPGSEESKSLGGDSPLDSLMVNRRNISQPALSTPPSARESPCDQFGRFGSIDEESSDEELEVTPTNSDDEGKKGDRAMKAQYQGVILRQKKKQQLEDPFADLLLSPKSSGRLRWSQELNPLYDYIKGFKADGVKLYDSSPMSKLLHSTTASSVEGVAGGGGTLGKPPSIILEDEGEQERAWSVSDDAQSVGSYDTIQSPTSLCSSFGESEEGSTLGEDIIPQPRVSQAGALFG